MILRHYMIRQVLTTTALVLGFLVVMLLGGRLIRYFGIAAKGGLDVGVLFTLIGYNLPYFLELILPLSFFIGLMLTFGRMYVDNEMAVLNGGGVSRGMLSRFLLPLMLVVFCVEAWLTLLGKPWGVAKASNIWQEQSAVKIFDLIRPKEFISSGDYHLYVGEVGKNGESLSDVIVVQMNSQGMLHKPTAVDGQLPANPQNNKDSIIFAKSATQVQSSDGTIRLDLHQGRRYEVNTHSRQYSQVGFECYRIALAGKSQDKEQVSKIEAVPTTKLLSWLDGQSTQFTVPHIKAELGYRFSLPWLIILALILATPLSAAQPRQGRWLRLIPAIFIFVANVLILISLKETISKGKIDVWIYPVAVLGLLAFAIYLNYHGRLFARVRLQQANIAHKETV